MKPIEIIEEEFEGLKENMKPVDMTYELLEIIEEFDNELNFNHCQVYISQTDEDCVTFLLLGQNTDYVSKYYKYSIEYKYPFNEEIDYMQVYKKNNFKVGTIDFSLEQLPKTDLFSKSFAILTAWNPNNQLTLSRINIMHNKELEKNLNNCKYSFDYAVGYLDDHMEKSFCVYDISFDEAIKLANKFNQYSIFYNDTNTLGYYNVETSKVILEKKYTLLDR